MKRLFIALSLMLLLTGCSSMRYRIAYDKSGRPVPIFNMPSDVIGETSIRVDSSGSVVIEVKSTPELSMIPIMTSEEFTRQGMLLRRTQTPMVAGIYHTRVNDSIGGMWSRIIRSASNFGGTILSGIALIFTGQGAATGAASGPP